MKYKTKRPVTANDSVIIFEPAFFKSLAMWVIKNKINNQFFAGWSEDNFIQTTDSKIYAAHFSSWDNAAYELRLLTSNWIAVPKEEA